MGVYDASIRFKHINPFSHGSVLYRGPRNVTCTPSRQTRCEITILTHYRLFSHEEATQETKVPKPEQDSLWQQLHPTNKREVSRLVSGELDGPSVEDPPP